MKVIFFLEHKVNPNRLTKHLHIDPLQLLVISVGMTSYLCHTEVNISFEMTLYTLMEALPQSKGLSATIC